MRRLAQRLKNRNYEWKYKLKFCLPVFMVLFALDWASKLAVMKTMTLGSSVVFIPGFLRFTYVINLGAAYGANQENPAVAITLATIFTAFVLILFISGTDHKWLMGLTILCSGSLGNLLGRTWSAAFTVASGATYRGGVIDFLQWDFKLLGGNDYIFNLADAFVIVGITFIVATFLCEIIVSIYKRATASKRPPAASNGAVEAENREVD